MLQRLRLILEDPERGDVPGWVLVTVMTAMLVVTLLAVASPLLSNVFSDAVNAVSDAGP